MSLADSNLARRLTISVRNMAYNGEIHSIICILWTMPWEVVSVLKNGFDHRCLHSDRNNIDFLGGARFLGVEPEFQCREGADFEFLAQNSRRS